MHMSLNFPYMTKYLTIHHPAILGYYDNIRIVMAKSHFSQFIIQVSTTYVKNIVYNLYVCANHLQNTI